MVDINEFGIANFRLARKVMSTGKCQCKPNERCPCPEWLNDSECKCGVFWENKIKLTKSEIAIVKGLIKKLSDMLKKKEQQ